jgi:hypothetical protein
MAHCFSFLICELPFIIFPAHLVGTVGLKSMFQYGSLLFLVSNLRASLISIKVIMSQIVCGLPLIAAFMHLRAFRCGSCVNSFSTPSRIRKLEDSSKNQVNAKEIHHFIILLYISRISVWPGGNDHSHSFVKDS